MQLLQVKFLGTRGSVPVEGPMYSKYGGATSCVLIRMADKVIVLDAGSGFMSLAEELSSDERSFSLFLSHLHTDHLLGLPICELMYNKDMKIDIYSTNHKGLTVREQIDTFMHPPLWPVGTYVFRADVEYHTITSNFNLGPIKVSLDEGNHPGGCTMYRFDYKDKSIVYATDYELNELTDRKLIDFSKNCTLLICDGQYSEDELILKKGFGHSSWMQAGRIALECNAKNLCIFHHDPTNSDETLDEAERELQKLIPHSFFAKKGGSILL